MPIPVGQAFKRTSADPVDESLLLTKAQMLGVNDDLMPDKYLTVCRDDGNIYVYDKNSTPNAVTGKFRFYASGVPEGGAEGMALVKKTDADGDVEWSKLINGGWGVAKTGIVQVPITSKEGQFTVDISELGIEAINDYNVALTVVGGGTGAWGESKPFLYGKTKTSFSGSVITVGADVDRVDLSYIVVAKGFGVTLDKTKWGVAKTGVATVSFDNGQWSDTATVSVTDLKLGSNLDYTTLVEPASGGTVSAWSTKSAYVASQTKDEFVVGGYSADNASGTLNIKYVVFAKGYGGGSGNGGGAVDTAMSSTSTNAVQNKVIKEYVDGKAGGATLTMETVSGVTDATISQDGKNLAFENTTNGMQVSGLTENPFEVASKAYVDAHGAKFKITPISGGGGVETNAVLSEGTDNMSVVYTKPNGSTDTPNYVYLRVKDDSFTFFTAGYISDQLDGKQTRLESGVNIKTINNQSLLGSGNIAVGGGGNTYIITKGTTTQAQIEENKDKDLWFVDPDDSSLAPRPIVAASIRLATHSSYLTVQKTTTANEVWEVESPNTWTLIQTNTFAKSSELGDLATLATTAKTDAVSAINELKSGIDSLGEPFRVKQWGSNAINVQIPCCTEDIANADIPKMVYTIDNVEGADYQIVGMLAYELFDAATGGNRINAWPVCQFTGNGQKELSVRWMCGGTTRKTAKRITAWVLLKHR